MLPSWSSLLCTIYVPLFVSKVSRLLPLGKIPQSPSRRDIHSSQRFVLWGYASPGGGKLTAQSWQLLSPHSEDVLASSRVCVGSLRVLWFPPTMPGHTSSPPGFSWRPVGVIASAENLTTVQVVIGNTWMDENCFSLSANSFHVGTRLEELAPRRFVSWQKDLAVFISAFSCLHTVVFPLCKMFLLLELIWAFF